VTGVRTHPFTVLASVSVLMGCATTQENTASASTSMFGRLRASQERTRWVRSFKPKLISEKWVRKDLAKFVYIGGYGRSGIC
jgi:hypothetical protein